MDVRVVFVCDIISTTCIRLHVAYSNTAIKSVKLLLLQRQFSTNNKLHNPNSNDKKVYNLHKYADRNKHYWQLTYIFTFNNKNADNDK